MLMLYRTILLRRYKKVKETVDQALIVLIGPKLGLPICFAIFGLVLFILIDYEYKNHNLKYTIKIIQLGTIGLA